MATRLTKPVRPGAMVLASLVVIGAAGCAPRATGPTYPPAGVTPAPAGAATDLARGAVVQALSTASLQVTDPGQPYEPSEGPWFAAAPRTVLQVQVPGEATPRFIVLYAFASPADAASAAADQASYVSHGAGRVMFANDTHFAIRVLGSTAIFFAYSAGSAAPQVGAIEQALDTIGTGVAVPG